MQQGKKTKQQQQKNVILACCQVVAQQHDYATIYEIDKNNQGSQIYLCDKFGSSTLNSEGQVGGQRNKQTEIFVYFNEKIAVAWLWDLPIVLCVYMENWRLGEQQQGPTYIIDTTLTA